MIIGIGTDIVEKRRIAQSISRFGDRFTRRILTSKELHQCVEKSDHIGSIAGRFAAKEALFKALGTGWAEGVGWKDVEILSAPNGRPVVQLSGKPACMCEDIHVHVSISHEKENAIAFVILEKPEGG